MNKRVFNSILKVGILAIFGTVIFWQISKNTDFDQIWSQFKSQLHSANYIFLIICLLLMPLNWIFEAEKWRRLLKPSISLNQWTSLKGILSGLVIGLMTPNRVGEYGGRIIVLPAEKNWDGVMATLAGSIAQNLVNWLFGGIGAFLFFEQHYSGADLQPMVFYISIVTIVIVFLTLYYKIGLLEGLLMRLTIKRWKSKVSKSIRALKSFSPGMLSNALFLSILRYLIYLAQYYFLLLFFGIELSIIESFVGISTIFVLQSAIPMPSLLSIFTRAEIALFVWGVFSFNGLAILATTYSLWVINLVLPATIGTFIIFRTNLLKSFGY